MKPQDIGFIIILIALILKRDARWFAIAGLIFLIGAIPLFAKWIFFSAQRFIDYSFLLFCIACIIYLVQNGKNKK